MAHFAREGCNGVRKTKPSLRGEYVVALYGSVEKERLQRSREKQEEERGEGSRRQDRDGYRGKRYHRREESKRDIDKDGTTRIYETAAPGRAAGREAAEPAGRLGRFIRDRSFIFSPASEYKRQFNYRGIFKGADRARAPLLHLSFSLYLSPCPVPGLPVSPLFRASASSNFYPPICRRCVLASSTT